MIDLEIRPGKRWLEILLLLASDLVGFGFAIGLVAITRHYIFHVQYSLVFDNPGVRTLFFLLLFLLAIFVYRGLYPGWKLSSVVELRQIVEAITLAYVTTSIIIFIQGKLTDFSRSVFILSWFFTIFILPIGRFLVRKLISRFPWWGEPVVVIGTMDRIREVALRLKENPRLGLRPVIGLAVDGIHAGEGNPSVERNVIPILAWSQKRLDQIQSAGLQTDILAIPLVDLREAHPKIFKKLENCFKETVFILSDDIFNFMLLQPFDIAGVQAILAKKSYYDKAVLPLKYLLDILIIVIFIIPILVIGGLLALWIRLDSPGPIFYKQQRLGRDQKPFWLFKFRTMLQNADDVLAKMLEDPNVRAEWEHYHKLKDDKRITRAGRWIRRMGLDELPQMINIILGEMSLVGPRPYLEAELEKMGEAAQILVHVRPGITGWWQVMGRNKIYFQERIRLELYYVSHWSLWLDFYVIIKTFWVVLFLRDGN
jgi:Undecaprenyl-phosphate galactose phosphotransferase WbaP